MKNVMNWRLEVVIEHVPKLIKIWFCNQRWKGENVPKRVVKREIITDRSNHGSTYTEQKIIYFWLTLPSVNWILYKEKGEIGWQNETYPFLLTQRKWSSSLEDFKFIPHHDISTLIILKTTPWIEDKE